MFEVPKLLPIGVLGGVPGKLAEIVGAVGLIRIKVAFLVPPHPTLPLLGVPRLDLWMRSSAEAIPEAASRFPPVEPVRERPCKQILRAIDRTATRTYGEYEGVNMHRIGQLSAGSDIDIRAAAWKGKGMATLGVYCIENWSGRRANKNSVEPLLKFLETSGVARSLHERVSTLDDLEHRVDDWAQRKLYPVGYLALHGSPESVWVGRHKLGLNDLLLLDGGGGDTAVDLRGKTLFIASCSTVATRRTALRNVVQRTGLNTVCGYASDVDWFEAAAFDMLVLSALATYRRPSDAIKYLHRRHGGFLRRMRFKSEPAWKP